MRLDGSSIEEEDSLSSIDRDSVQGSPDHSGRPFTSTFTKEDFGPSTEP